MIKNYITNIKDKITTKMNTIKEENEKLKELLKNTTTFQNLFPIPTLSIEIKEQKISTITNKCPDINKEKAQIISNLIPIDETYLTIIYSKELKSSIEYYIIPTNKYLWVISNTSYGIFPYVNLNCQIIKNNLMSKIILINNILLEINGSNEKINNFISIITNNEIRENIIKEKTNYLCGIIPIYQKINSINSGISIDNNSNIVFHTKTENYKCTTNDIAYYELLLDNSIVFSSKNNTANKITNFQNNCYQISIRIILKNEQTIILPILEPNAFNTKYQRQDTIFQKNFSFAEELINKLKSLISPY